MVLYLIVTVFLVLEFLFLFFIWGNKKRALPHKEDRDQYSEGLSIVIPFRNEESRMAGLIESVNGLDIPLERKVEFLFIDDHSADRGSAMISSRLDAPFRLLRNKIDERGKKQAIHRGVQASRYNWILTLDADVSFRPNYINQVMKLSKKDLNVLPVAIKTRGLVSAVMAIDFMWLQLVTHFHFFKRSPVLCNGANLLFSRELYYSFQNDRNDMDVASGDDLFLLEYAKKNGFAIQSVGHDSLSVETLAESKWREFVDQRKRWVSKMGQLRQAPVHRLLLFAYLSYSLLGLGLMTYAIFEPMCLVLLGIKVILEFAGLAYLRQTFSIQFFSSLILNQFWQPFYMAWLLLVPSHFTWRGEGHKGLKKGLSR